MIKLTADVILFIVAIHTIAFEVTQITGSGVARLGTVTGTFIFSVLITLLWNAASRLQTVYQLQHNIDQMLDPYKQFRNIND